MEELLPLLIAIGASIFFSVIKKKKKPEQDSPADSPWWGGNSDPWNWSRPETEEDAEYTHERERSEYPEGQGSKSERTAESFPAKTAAAPVSASTYTAPSAEAAAYNSSRTATSSAAAPHAVSHIAANEYAAYEGILEEEGISAISHKYDEEIIAIGDAIQEEKSAIEQNKEDIFENGFDFRLAVLYSEIMAPKFKEY